MSELYMDEEVANILMYGLADDERLSEEMDDIIERVLDDACEKVGESFDAIASRIEWPIKVKVFRRKVISDNEKARIAEYLLDQLLEKLDEENMDTDGDPTKATASMREASKAFVESVVSGYFVWACEPTGVVVEISREQAKKYETTMENEESDELKRLRQMERHQKLYESNIRDLHSCIEVKDMRIKELEKKLKDWQWKCSDVLKALSSVELAVVEYKANEAKIKAEGSR